MTNSILILLLLAQGANTTATAKREIGERAADGRDKLICKRFVETGSLVRGYRVCKTKWDWERERDALRAPNQSSACGGLAESGRCG